MAIILASVVSALAGWLASAFFDMGMMGATLVSLAAYSLSFYYIREWLED